MADNRELKGKCIFGYVNLFPYINKFGGQFTAVQPQLDQFIPESYMHQTDPNLKVKSDKLIAITRGNGAILPMVNRYIGAPLCTYVYGGVANEEIHPHTPYLKGPALSAEYDTSKFTWTDTKIGDTIGSFNNENNMTDPYGISAYNGSCDFPTIPATSLDASYHVTETPEILTTYNIWKLDYKTMGKIPVVKTYKKYQGPIYDDPDYKGARLYQISNNNTVSIAVVAPTSKAILYRLFPLCQDAMYEANSKLYYPSDSVAIAPKTIGLTSAGVNCGFQMHFSYNDITEQNGQLSKSNITIMWGDHDKSPDRFKKYRDEKSIAVFKLIMSPGEKPQLWYEHPYYKKWLSFEIHGPIFGENNNFDVYVHYAGPNMYVGFNENPSSWTIFPPIPENLEYGSKGFMYPQIPASSKISMSVNNMITTFQYAPIAFNNYNKSQLDYLTAGDFYYDSYGRSIYRTALYTNDDEIITSDNFNKHRYTNENIMKTEDKDAMITTPTWYVDWRKDWNAISKELIYTQISNTTNDGYTYGKVIWDTTVEGPIFNFISNVTNNIAPEIPEIMQSLGEIGDATNFLTEWNVDYSQELTNRSFLKGTATITLKNLIANSNGKKLLNLLEENILSVTLGGGYEKNSTFFQGIVDTCSTTRSGQGSMTTVTCTDLASKILEESNFQAVTMYPGIKYNKIIEHGIKSSGLGPWYKFWDSISDTRLSTTAAGYWELATDTRLGLIPLANGSITSYLSSSITTKIYDIISVVLKMIWKEYAYPIMYWNPAIEELTLCNKLAFQPDKLLFMGKPINSETGIQEILLPDESNIHGVLENEYTITSENTNLNTRGIVTSMGWWNYPIYREYPIDALIPNEAIDFANLPGWVGYNKFKWVDITSYGRQTYGDCDDYLTKTLIPNIIKPYSDIKFNVYVKEPLQSWGTFYIETFDPEGLQSADPDIWYYAKVSYKFNKENNTIIASIEGAKNTMGISAWKMEE